MNYRPEVVIRWQVCPPSDSEFAQIKDKIEAIIDNIEDVYDYSTPPRKGTIHPCQLMKIVVDCDDDPEAFDLYVCSTSDGEFAYRQKDSKNSFGAYEVLTEAAARFNDHDFNCGRPELGDHFDYVLGEVNSEYTKLGESDFYYRYL